MEQKVHNHQRQQKFVSKNKTKHLKTNLKRERNCGWFVGWFDCSRCVGSRFGGIRFRHSHVLSCGLIVSIKIDSSTFTTSHRPSTQIFEIERSLVCRRTMTAIMMRKDQPFVL